MTETSSPLWRAIRGVAARRGLKTPAEIARASGVAYSTLGRMQKGSGGRGDALAKLEAALDLGPGTLARVRAGELDPDELITDPAVGTGAFARGADVAFRSGSTQPSVIHDLTSEASRIAQAERSATEGALFRLALNQLQKRGLVAMAPNNPRQSFDLIVMERYPTGEPPEGGNTIRALVDCRAVGDSTDAVFGAIRDLKARVRELAEDEDELDMGSLVQLLVIEREPTEEEVGAYRATGVRILHPGDWSPLDELEHTSDDGSPRGASRSDVPVRTRE